MSYIESLRVFLRATDLGSLTAGGRDLRLTPAVASKRMRELEARLGVRLFNRTTRRLSLTEAGATFLDHARRVIAAVEEGEAALTAVTGQPRGWIRASAPLGVGRRIVAPLIPRFADIWPDLNVHLRLSDRRVDMFEDRIDVAFFLGTLKDSSLKRRKIADCERVLVASPAYVAACGIPGRPEDLLERSHNCLLLRFPRSPEYAWTLQTGEGHRQFEVRGRYDSDDADVLTAWALEGRGIANRPRFEVAAALAAGALVEVLPETPPVPASFACLYPHRRHQDPKIRVFVDFMVEESRAAVARLLAGGIAVPPGGAAGPSA